MSDPFSGKFEFRIWLTALVLLTDLVLSLLSDQATFVHTPQNRLEALLTWLPVWLYGWTSDRTTCFVLSLIGYGTALGAAGLILWTILARHLFEPLFFRRMIQAKLREEELINRYINRLKP